MAEGPQLISSSQISQTMAMVGNPATIQASDGGLAPIVIGHQQELMTSDVHGRRYEAASRGNVFVGTTGTGGLTIIAAGQTTAGFCFYNPVSSGVLMEVHKIRVLPKTATDVVGTIGLEYGAPPSTAGTPVVPATMPLSGARTANLCKVQTGGTIVAMTYLCTLNFIQTTAGLAINGGEYDFDGALVLYPGSCVNIVATPTQSTNVYMQEVWFSEWLM